MGTGIGIVAARVAGSNVRFIEARDEGAKRSLDFITSWADKEIAKEKMNLDDKKQLLSKITYHKNISEIGEVDFAIEVEICKVTIVGC